MNESPGLPHIAIVGLGISGLSCATHLAEAGLRLTLFDKGRRPGGRFNTRESRDAPERRFDHGAQYFTARDPSFRERVKALAAAGLLQRWEVPFAEVRPAALHPQLGPEAPLHLEEIVSDHDDPRWVGSPSMQSFPAALTDALRATGRVTVNCGVRVQALRLDPSGEGWRLATDAGLAGPFDAVVVTAPPAQAAELFDSVESADGITISLQGWAREARAAPVDPCWAVMFEWAPGTGPALPFEAATIEGGAIAWLARDGSKPGRDDAARWVLHTSPGFTREHLEATEGEIVRRVEARLASLCERLGTHRPEPSIWTAAHRWRYARPTGGPEEAFRLSPEGLAWCGDLFPTAGRGRVEAAWLSGASAANGILGITR